MSMIETKAEHTPPPWVWRKVGNDWVLWQDKGMRPIVLDCGRVGAEKGMRLRVNMGGIMRAFDPEYPDARLIAAAPELLEAVKVLHVRVFMLEGKSEAYDAATAVLAKHGCQP